MAGFSWKDLQKKRQPQEEVNTSPIHSLEEVGQLSPVLADLLNKRAKLEAEMQSMTETPLLNRIYPVQTLAERRRELHQWETNRQKITDLKCETTKLTEHHPQILKKSETSEKITTSLKDRLPDTPLNIDLKDRFSTFITENRRYEALKERLLSVEVGSVEVGKLDEIGQRLNQQRDKALKKLIAAREQEAHDTNRRERALKNHKMRQREQEFKK
ncbi:MAG: hypothetical protein EA373_03040 [Oceanospirillales bacterium]|nr:MAG: hypothetical protein EA373_03040 [Oceanospirillales bacterium]